jgi:uncharacterized protein YjiS (DUF1127 family)
MSARSLSSLSGIGSASPPRSPGRSLLRVLDQGRAAIVRARQRRLLAALDDRTLRDIGVTRSDAGAEANKPFWQR